jgi:4-hydroxysphinganine ceramide fatty acyl 2-hydroxylase
MARSQDRIFALADVQNRKSPVSDTQQLFADLRPDKTRSSAYVSFKGAVYDITTFLPDHPGGDDIMLDYVGGDIGQIMADESQHVHSRSAYDMMEEYKIGELGGDEKIVSEGMS